MAVVQESTVGITSNPDVRPATGSTTIVTTANWLNDPNKENITYCPGGRKPVVAVRNKNPYAVTSNN